MDRVSFEILFGLVLAIFASGCLVKDAGQAAASGGGGGSSSTARPFSLSFSDGANVSLGTVATGSTTLVFLSVHVQGSGTATITGSSHSHSDYTFNGGSYPGTGGTCGTSISSNCSIAVAFTSASVGVMSDTLTLQTTVNGAASSLSIALTANVLPPAAVTISDGLTYDFGTRIVGSTTSKTFTAVNGGGTVASSLSGAALAAPFAYVGGAYPGTGGTCGTSLSAGASCTVVVNYAPTGAGASAGTLTLNYNTGASTTTATRPMQGTGQSAASLTISDGTTYDFGNQVINGTAAQKIFTVTNAGAASATSMAGSGLAAPFAFMGGSYPGTGGTCDVTLAGSGTCTMIVTYAPTALGAATDTIELAYNTGVASTSTSRPVQGNGVSGAVLTISDGTTYDYGSKTVGSSTDKTFVVSYSGTVAATSVAGTGLAAPFSYKDGSYPGTGGDCGNTISADCTIVVTFEPSASAVSTDTIQLNYDNGATTTSALRPVQGTGLSAATLTISNANTYDFGTLTSGDRAEHTFVVTYTGQSAATGVNPGALVDPYFFKGGAYPGTGGSCGATISTNCTIVVTFEPSSAGVFNATLSLDFSDGATARTATRALTGTGATAANLTISEAPDFDYGTRAVGSTTNQPFTVSNIGDTDATSIVPSNLLTPFEYAGGTFPGTGGDCGGTLIAGDTCTVVIEFAPLAVGGYSETFALDYDDGVSAAYVARPLTGTAGSVANLSISDGPTYAYGTVATAYTSDATLTVTNVGGASATLVSETTLAAPFAFKGGTFPGTGGNCTGTIVNAASCTLVVTYAPTGAANHSGTLTLSYHNGNTTVTSSRALSGIGATLTSVIAGAQHSCVLYSTGIVRCWGADGKGQLGNDAALAGQLDPATVSGITNASGITAGSEHTCARLSNGRISCWGSDSNGQLGDDGTFADQATPVTVATTTDFTQVSAGGGNLTCGLRTGGAVQCWGDDAQGGNGNANPASDNATPVNVNALDTTAVEIAVGESHGCALLSDDTMECWGWDNHGQLGNSALLNNNTSAVAVSGVNSGAKPFSGGRISAVRLNNGDLEIWGDDTTGQLGDGGANTDRSTPVAFSAMDDALQISGGSTHSCGITAAGAPRCWGADDVGQLGDTVGLADQAAPVAVSGLASVTSISAGGAHSCAIASTGLVYCWGSNTSGQLGTGVAGGHQATPVLVQGL